MPTKTIGVREEVYERLRARKRDDESFTDLIDRLIDENLLDPSAAGAVEDPPAVGADPERLAGVLQDRRKTFQDLLDDAESKVHSVTGERVVEWSEVEQQVAAGQYEAAAELVLDPGGVTPPDPGPKKAELLDLVGTVDDLSRGCPAVHQIDSLRIMDQFAGRISKFPRIGNNTIHPSVLELSSEFPELARDPFALKIHYGNCLRVTERFRKITVVFQ